MRGSVKLGRTLNTLAVLFVVAAGVARAAAPAREAGETLLGPDEVQKLLTELPAFKSRECLKARIVSETDDLLGTRTVEGELLLDRPSRMLRKFTKPTFTFWLLDSKQVREYAPASKQLLVKDFAGAPRKWQLVEAAFQGDVKTLQSHFDVFVFRKPGETGQPALYRFVLNLKAGPGNPASHRCIQGRLFENGLFFHELLYVPRDGNATLDRYSEIAAIPKPTDAEFAAAVALPDGVEVKKERVDESER
jgi:hypothetical protein